MRKTTLVLLLATFLAACSGSTPKVPTPAISKASAHAATATALIPQTPSSATFTTAPAVGPMLTVIPPASSTPPPTVVATRLPAVAPTLAPPTNTPVRRATNTPRPAPADVITVEAQVVKVVDGDTIDVSIGGKTYSVPTM